MKEYLIDKSTQILCSCLLTLFWLLQKHKYILYPHREKMKQASAMCQNQMLCSSKEERYKQKLLLW